MAVLVQTASATAGKTATGLVRHASLVLWSKYNETGSLLMMVQQQLQYYDHQH